jgi:predicted RNA-binding Zn-ribbon protein involved in translation (DUF1610 family)
MQAGSHGSERRCPDCGALAGPDADWCGQCFRALREPQPQAEAVAIAGAPARPPREVDDGPAGRRAPTWPCPACGNENALELDACAVCGTTFAALMRVDDAPPTVDPKDAMAASLIFPGLGHRKAGRGLDGLARGVLFAVLAAMAATMFVSGVDSAGTFGVFALFLGGALIVYLGSAWEAYHIAGGGRPLVSSRALLWATVGVILASVMLLAVSVATVARR